MPDLPYPRLRLSTTPGQYLQTFTRLLTTRYATGPNVQSLEAQVAALTGTAHCIAVPMARTGIYLALKSLESRGEKVILSPYTVSEVVNMVICAGYTPVFADIDEQTCNISPTAVEKLIDDDTAAVIVTHFYGLMCDMEKLTALCSANTVSLIEDAAQAFGASLNGQSAGSFGRAGVFSFNLYKSVNSFLGGCVVTDDANLAGRIRQNLSEFPVMPHQQFFRAAISGLITDLATFPPIYKLLTYPVLRYGFLNEIEAINRRIKNDTSPVRRTTMPAHYLTRTSDLQAGLALNQLDKFRADMNARLERARLYDAGLSDIDELLLPPLRTDGSHCYWYYPIQFDRRHDLVSAVLRDYGDIAESYHQNCAEMACFKEFHLPCPSAEKT